MVFILNEVIVFSLISLLSQCVRLVFWRQFLENERSVAKTLLKPPPFIEKIEIDPPVVKRGKVSNSIGAKSFGL